MTQDERLHPPSQPRRESIWSIEVRWKAIYFALFTILSTINVARVIWYHTTQVAYENWSLASDAVMHGIGVNVIGSAAASITITELGRSFMVLGGLIQEAINERRRKQIAAARSEERAETIAEVNARIQELNDRSLREWNVRRIQAEEKGEPFNEPPPEPIDLDLSDIGGNGAQYESGRNGA